jgi:hypothetical protein
MPKEFTECVRNNGKVRTISGPNKDYGLKEGQYRHICVLDGKTALGHVKTKKKGK